MNSQIVETWSIHNRINIYLLHSINPEHLSCVSASKGRSVFEQFAHIHNVRLMWIQSAKPELLEGLQKIEKGTDVDALLLEEYLTESSKKIEALLNECIGEGKVKGFKPHPIAFFGYIISHESHHRGQILLTLKQAGHPVDKKTQFGLWEWGTR